MKPQPSRRRTLMALPLTLAVALLGAGTLALAPLPAIAQTPDAAFEAAFAQFQRTTTGDTSAIDPAATQFGELLAAKPADPVLRAYSGAATALRATTTMMPWKKMSYAEDGLAQIDKALAQLTQAHDAPAHHGTPASLEVRLVAATTFLGLPEMFNRQARGARLLDELLGHPLLAASPLGFRGAVWLRAGLQAAKDKRTDDARRWLQQVVSSGAPQAAQALAQLNGLAS